MKRIHIPHFRTPNPPNTVRVTRPSRWGNPYRVVKAGKRWRVMRKLKTGDTCYGDYAYPENAARGACELFGCWLCTPEGEALVAVARRELTGHDLACTCPLDQPCHADVWIEVLK